MISLKSLKERANRLKTDTYALCLACKDPRVPRRAKFLIAIVVGYALSPIDLIPDFIPVIGYLDDLIIVPAGISIALKMIPKEVLEECRAKAKSELATPKSKWIMTIVIILVWLLAAFLIMNFVFHIVR